MSQTKIRCHIYVENKSGARGNVFQTINPMPTRSGDRTFGFTDRRGEVRYLDPSINSKQAAIYNFGQPIKADTFKTFLDKQRKGELIKRDLLPTYEIVCEQNERGFFQLVSVTEIAPAQEDTFPEPQFEGKRLFEKLTAVMDWRRRVEVAVAAGKTALD